MITDGDGEESLEEFHNLVEQLCQHYEPVGIVEESLVQTIATCWWRKARVIRAENGEIRRHLDILAVDRALRHSDNANLDLALSAIPYPLFSGTNRTDQKVSTKGRMTALQEIQTTLRGDSRGLAYLRALLETAKNEIRSSGYLSEERRKTIFNAFCFLDYFFASACLNAGPPTTTKQDRQSENDMNNKSPDKRDVDEGTDNKPAFVVACIDYQLTRISLFEGYATERENLALDAEARSFSLPPVEATDKLLRYETHLDKQLYRAMDQLERLQRQRRGENVPPPLNINMGTGK